jgi:hypothetical protein
MRPKKSARSPDSDANRSERELKLISTADKDENYCKRLNVLKQNEALKQEIYEYRMAVLLELGNMDIHEQHLERILAYLQGQIFAINWILGNIINKNHQPQPKSPIER